MSPAQRLIYNAILGLTSQIDDLEDQISSVENDVEDLKGLKRNGEQHLIREVV